MIPSFIREAIYHYLPSLNGWTTPGRACEMVDCILSTKAKVCVDIGVFAGRSTLAMGFAARQLQNSMVYGIDPWNQADVADNDDHKEGVDWWKENVNLEEIHREAMRMVWDHHLEPWVTIIRAKSEHVHQLFPVIDFLNVDGGHSEENSCRDAQLYVPKVRSGGYIFVDDTSWESTQKMLGIIEQSCDLVNTVQDKTESRTYKKR